MSTENINLIKGEFPETIEGKRELFNLISEDTELSIAVENGVEVGREFGLEEIPLSWAGKEIAIKHKHTGWLTGICKELSEVYEEWLEKERIKEELQEKKEKEFSLMLEKYIENSCNDLFNEIKEDEKYNLVLEEYCNSDFEYVTKIKELKEKKSFNEYKKWIMNNEQLEEMLYYDSEIFEEFKFNDKAKEITKWVNYSDKNYLPPELEELMDETKNLVVHLFAKEIRELLLSKIKKMLEGEGQ